MKELRVCWLAEGGLEQRLKGMEVLFMQDLRRCTLQQLTAQLG